MTTFQDVAAFIGGASQAEVDSIFNLCKNRTKVIGTVAAAEAMSTMKPGDKVMITGRISPKYLIGATGTVSAQPASRSGSISVVLDHGAGRFSGITPIGVPASCLTKV
jgi:hypothetical protein